mmetsp:Transcript_25788/g.61914  ORF Transcript_25788/g.61914 Transcript_25788/m.61914 type:complete len:525 (+) Transcript_25788:30-1604(+)|eukprot:CAMPEP_0181099708 /NCGR_PEP_ID=MMETSP1071-20121207/12802_1 /TAXON_ID=35127 /ORGANISM="Thalassiosira sp., Strain NH16" /LENGTH=524 /DNA_ID=CAMNT_0023182385 /DNA_START=21 /DNA_END=1595 /DNA_ORIENTATION=-
MNASYSFVAKDDSLRLADFLKKNLQIWSNKYHVRRCLQEGWITVNRVIRVEKCATLAAGDLVAVDATAFQISQLRFKEPLLRNIHDDARCKILYKPSGMPRDGQDSVTVENALPASMENEHYDVVDCVGRIVSGPVIVNSNRNDSAARQTLLGVPKRYTFQLIVHGIPSNDQLDLPGFVLLRILRTITSTTGELSLIQVILTHSGDGLRGCLKRIGCPVLGTSVRTKSAAGGSFIACTNLRLQWKDQEATILDMELPVKFDTTLEKEKCAYEIKKQREEEDEERQAQLRKEYIANRMGMTPCDQLSLENLSMTSQWSIASFRKLSFYITDDVMSPKQSSEILLLAAKEHLPKSGCSVLDLGVGSGCLLVSTLVDACSSTRGVGVDISAEALKIAQINIHSHGLGDQITLQQGNFNDLSFLGSARFDMVLCNPPYLTEGEMKKDRPSGPRVALVAEHKGYACYEMVARQVANYLTPDGLVILEVGGKRKADTIRAMFRDLDHVETRRDNQRHDRCLVLRKVSAIG